MKKRGSTQNILIVALSIVVIAMSVGFATIERDLEVTGTINLTGNKFEVKFKDNSYSETANSVAATNVSLTGTSGTYTITLEKPGDFYEFSGVVENTGDFDAYLDSITLTNSLSADQKKYITYTFTYGSNSYTASATNLTGLNLTKKTGTETFKVRVDYVMPDDENDLLTENIDGITLGFKLHYVQGTN